MTEVTVGSLGGEFALIDRIAASVAPAEANPLSVGIGDDAAVLAPSNGQTQTIVTTDLLIEDVHFRLSYGDFYSLGVKAAAVNLSDIAAMGGRPTVAFISLALPKGIEVADLDALYQGMNETFARYGAMIGGGDTNLSPGPLTINVTLLGETPTGRAILRSTARVGDAILVTGALGAATAGFALLEASNREAAESISPEAVEAQLRPIPRLLESSAAVATGGITAMMDLSDGLSGDLAKLCRASGVGAEIVGAALPVSEAAETVAKKLGQEIMDFALTGGEDYELLFTAAPEKAEFIREAVRSLTGTLVTAIGTITDGEEIVLLYPDGRRVALGLGWDHFHG